MKTGTTYYFYIKGIKVINGAQYFGGISNFVYAVTTGSGNIESSYSISRFPLKSYNVLTRLKSAEINSYDNEPCETDKLVDEDELDKYLETGYIDTTNKSYNTYWKIYQYGRDGLNFSILIDLKSVQQLDKFFILVGNKIFSTIYYANDIGKPWIKVSEISNVYNSWQTVDFNGVSGRFIKIAFDQHTYSSFSNGFPSGYYNGGWGTILKTVVYVRNIKSYNINILPVRRRAIEPRTVDQFFCVNGHFYQPGRIHSLCSGSNVRLFGAAGHFMDSSKPYTKISDLKFRLSNIPWTKGNNGSGRTLEQMLITTYKRYGLKPFITFSSILDICRYQSTSPWNRPVDDYWYPGAWKPLINPGYQGDIDYLNITTNPTHYKTYGKLAYALSAKYGSVVSDISSLVDTDSETELTGGLDLLSGVEPGNEMDAGWNDLRGYTTPEESAALISSWYDGNTNGVDELGNPLGVINIDPNFQSIHPGTAGCNFGYFYYSLLHWRLKRGDSVIPTKCFNYHNYMSNIGDQGNSALAVQYAITYEHMLDNLGGSQIRPLIEMRDRYAPATELWNTEFGYGEGGSRNSASKYQCYSQPGVKISNTWTIPDRHRSDVKGAWTVRATLTMISIGLSQCNYYSTESESSWFNTGQYGSGAGLEMFRWQELTDTTPGAKVNAIQQYEVPFGRGGFSAMGLFGTFLGNGAYPISRAFWWVATMRNTLKDYVYIGKKAHSSSDKIIILCFRKKNEAKGAYAIYYNDYVNTGLENIYINVPDGITEVKKITTYVPNTIDPTTVPQDC